MKKRERTYGPYSRLPVAKAAELRGISPGKVTKGMDEFVKSDGVRGLRHVEEESRGRRNRWTNHRWLDEWEDRLADEMLAKKKAARRTVRKKTDTDLIGSYDENGMSTISGKELTKRLNKKLKEL